MRYRGAPIPLWSHGACCLYRSRFHGVIRGHAVVRTYSTPNPSSPHSNPTPPHNTSSFIVVKERIHATVGLICDIGKQWGHKSLKTATATVNYWWDRYEEFVGLNEVRDAQTKVTAAEQAFMVARGMVRESHDNLEVLQVRLKEVRDRLDRVSREEAHYLELATMEHKLLQEERRLRTAYENAERIEREKFNLFSAGVRESHEKERTRAERTKNWSVIGSVLGAVIGVMGSTYINRVRLQELKNLLLEAQKGPVSLQEAIRVQAGNHRTQQYELQALIDSMRGALKNEHERQDGETKSAQSLAPIVVLSPTTAPTIQQQPQAQESVSAEAWKELIMYSQKAQIFLETLQPQLGQLEKGINEVEADVLSLKDLIESRPPVELPVTQSHDSQLLVCDTETVIHGLEETERRIENYMNRNTLFNTVVTYTAFALSVSTLYFIFRST